MVDKNSDRFIVLKDWIGQDNSETIASRNQIEKVTFVY